MGNWGSRWRRAIEAIAAMAALGAAPAFADGTDAGASVENTFTLDYTVGGAAQTQITNSATPTTFTVDRKVNLTVTATGDTNAAAGSANRELVFGVRNLGNDNQAYAFSIENLASDDFDPANLTATIYADAGDDNIFTPGTDDAGAGAAYTLGSADASADVNPDTTIWVVISGDIPGAAGNGDVGTINLVADSLNPVISVDPNYTQRAGDPAVTSASNAQLGESDTALIDPAGVAAADGPRDGNGSAQASYIVNSTVLSADKSVSVIATEASAIDCANDAALAAPQFAAPGACIEYRIEVTNATGSGATASDIDISDQLPDDVAFVAASENNLGGSITTPAGGCASNCVVALTGASLAAGQTGALVIRATVR